MAFNKYALVDVIDGDNLISASKIAGSEPALAQFRTVTDELRETQVKAGGKQLSPKVDDFLYAHCIMMHAAEASLIDQETGKILLNKAGKPVTGGFIPYTDERGNESVKWESSDDILPYRNGNGDIFPEEDLVQAHKEWVGKPLCRDHVSDSVEGIRGVIVDTYYDENFKRVHALFALDRKNYGELARKIEAGYATSVSMGTAVGRSICTECGNVATIAPEYCEHVRMKQAHGEINKDLSPIELSIVVTGADPKAKILTVLAAKKALARYENMVQKVASGEAEPSTLNDIRQDLNVVRAQIENASPEEDAVVKEILEALSVLKTHNVSPETRALGEKIISSKLAPLNKTVETLTPQNRKEVIRAAQAAQVAIGEGAISKHLQDILGEETGIGDVDLQPGMVSRENTVTNELVDSSGYSLDKPEVDLGLGDISQAPNSTIASLYVGTKKDPINEQNLANKIASLENQISELEKQFAITEEKNMTFAELKRQRQERKAYWQGTEEPTPGKPQYPLMGDQDGIREKDDKQMHQDGNLGGTDGLVPGDEQVKKEYQRAELEQRMQRRAEWLAQIKEAGGTVVEMKDGTKTLVDEQTGERLADDGKTAAKKDEDDKEDKKDDDKKDESKDEKKDDDKKSEDKDDKKEDKKDDDKKDEDKDEKKKSEAYYQGTEEPTPGKPQYAKMTPPDQDVLREKDDKHMLQTGPLGGTDGLVPGDEQVKRELQRMAGKVGAKLFKGAEADQSRWVFTENDKPVLAVTASQAYGKFLSDRFTEDSTYSDLFHSKEWGKKVMAKLKEQGIEATAKELNIKVAQPPVAPAAEPAPEPEMAPLPGDEVPAGEDDLAAKVGPLVEEVEALLEKIKTEVQGPDEGLEDLDVGAGEAPGMEAPEAGAEELPGPGGALASQVTGENLLEAFAFLNDVANELSFVEAKFAEKKDSENFAKAAEQAIHDARLALDHSNELLNTYVEGRKQAKLAERADRREKLVTEATGMMDYGHDHDYKEKEDMAADYKAEDMGHDHDYKENMAADAEEMVAVHELVEDEAKEEVEKHEDEMHLNDMADDYMAHDYESMSAEARRQWREDLVKEAGQYDDVYEGERSGGGHTLEGLGMSVADNGDKVETLSEVHDAMMDVATKPLSKVREAAEKLDTWMKEGGINPDKLNKLVTAGAVNVDADVLAFWNDNFNKEADADGEAKSYYSSYWGEVDGGKEWAGQLTSEFDKGGNSKKASEEREVRIRRAFTLGMDAQAKGVVAKSAAALEQYVDTLVDLPDEQFNALKKHIAMLKAPQGLNTVPQVGITNRENGEHGLDKAASPSEPNLNDLRLIFS